IAEGSLTPVWGLTKAFNCYNYYRNILPGYCECQPGKDRPIGVQWNGTDPGGGEFRGATLLITREAIEKALNAPPTASGLPPGVVSVRCLDQGPLFDGDYEMFIKVERVGGPPATPPSGTAPTPGTAPAPTVDVAPPAPMQRTVAPEPAASSTPSPSGPDRPTRTSEGTVVRLPERSGFPSLPSASPAPPASGSTGTVPPGSTATPAPVSGTYLVSVTAVWCSRMTRDDPFDRDGKGDEIYAAAFVRRYDRTTFQLVETTNLRTLGYGDTNGRSDRALGGTMTRTGGVGPGNVLPPGGTPARTQPAQASVLPMRVWQGTLTDGADALVISPTIWEDDDTPTFFAQWVQGQQQLSSWIFTLEKVQTRITTRAFAPLVLESTERISYGADQKVANVTGGIIAAGFGIPWNFDQFFVQKMDRPIGVAQNDFNSLAVPNTVVVLTREVIEMALSASPPPVDTPAPGVIFHRTKPGVMVITFQDTATEAFRNVAPHTDYGHYVMTLQVERL
ncbi:MAG TPA: hypothetical protein VHF69_08810, partial [Candidatus Synoicihabitans sp.]|nr:hypothetical protein [Candidatus Synoicihabitans sp.]